MRCAYCEQPAEAPKCRNCGAPVKAVVNVARALRRAPPQEVRSELMLWTLLLTSVGGAGIQLVIWLNARMNEASQIQRELLHKIDRLEDVKAEGFGTLDEGG